MVAWFTTLFVSIFRGLCFYRKMIFLTLIEDGSYASKMRSTLFSTREKVSQVQFEKSDKSFQIATVPHIFGLSYSTYSKKKTCSNGCLLVMSFEFLCGCTFLQLKTILIRCSLVMSEQKAANYCDHLASSLP